MNKHRIANLILRIGIAFAFSYAAIAGFIEPDSWIGYFPKFMRSLVGDTLILDSWGLFQIVLALWILSGKKIAIPLTIGIISLTGLIIFNLNQFDVIFRDVTIISTLVALLIIEIPILEKGNIS